MLPLFLGLTLVNLICLAVASVLGIYRPGGTHVLSGALAALVCVGVHCVVFTYFIATAKWVRHAIAVKRLDPALAEPTRSFRMQAFPGALAAMASVFAAAVAGAARDNYMTSGFWHHTLSVIAVAV